MAPHPHRIGLILPATNTVMAEDLRRGLGSGFEVHTDRMLLHSVDAEGEQRMLDEEALPSARRVACVEPERIVFGCTSASALHGPEYDAAFRAQLERETGVPVVGVLSSALAQLEGAAGIAVLTPYVEDLTERIAASLRGAGLPVLATRGLGHLDNLEIGRIEPEEIVEALRSMPLEGADTVFCSCTNLRAFQAREAIAEATGLRVVTSNHAVVQEVLRTWQRT